MYHISNFGKFAEPLKQFADLNGQVPEQGDAKEGFHYPSDYDWTANEWADWCRSADAAAESAQQDLNDWREGRNDRQRARRANQKDGTPLPPRRKPGPAPKEESERRVKITPWVTRELVDRMDQERAAAGLSQGEFLDRVLLAFWGI